jgi:hypothetical protein
MQQSGQTPVLISQRDKQALYQTLESLTIKVSDL